MMMEMMAETVIIKMGIVMMVMAIFPFVFAMWTESWLFLSAECFGQATCPLYTYFLRTGSVCWGNLLCHL